MEPLLLVGGIVVLLVTTADALSTTIAPDSGGGAVTGRLGRAIWVAARRLSRTPGGPLERGTGPTVAVTTVATWLVGLWLGWFLIFSASPGAVVHDATGLPSDGWSRLYFAGFTVFTLGLGDHAPGASPWQVATVLGTISGLAFTTLAITFLLPVVTAVTQRRQQARRISGLGEDAQAVVVNGWIGDGFDELGDVLTDLADELLLTAERRLAYPILAYFHAATPGEDHRVQLAVVDEVVTLLRCGVDRDQVQLPDLALRMVRHAAVQQLERATMPGRGHGDAPPLVLDLEPLRAAGIPTVTDEELDRRAAADAEHRRRIAGLVASTGWGASSAVRTRAA